VVGAGLERQLGRKRGHLEVVVMIRVAGRHRLQPGSSWLECCKRSSARTAAAPWPWRRDLPSRLQVSLCLGAHPTRTVAATGRCCSRSAFRGMAALPANAVDVTFIVASGAASLAGAMFGRESYGGCCCGGGCCRGVASRTKAPRTITNATTPPGPLAPTEVRWPRESQTAKCRESAHDRLQGLHPITRMSNRCRCSSSSCCSWCW
jgi:hypothetical protein